MFENDYNNLRKAINPESYDSGFIVTVTANTFLTMCRVRICASW